VDNCPFTSNPAQQDSNNNGIGDVCDDQDSDGVFDTQDNCPTTFNPDQRDGDGDGIGDACAVDLRIGRFEVTQAIQTLDNSLPLVVGKPTWVRVYLLTGVAQTPVTNVTGKLVGFLPTGGTEEIRPIPTFITAEPNPDRGNTNHTLNFRLPERWFIPHSHTMLFTIVVNPDRAAFEINYSNNELLAGTRIFQEMPQFNLTFVPVRVNGCTPTLTEFLQCVDYLRQVYPLSRFGLWQSGVLDYDQDPTCHNQDMLWQIWKRNFMTDDPAPRMHYFGLVCQVIFWSASNKGWKETIIRCCHPAH